MRVSTRTLRSTLTGWLVLTCASALLVLSAGAVLQRRASFQENQDRALLTGAGELVARLLKEGDVARLTLGRLGEFTSVESGDTFCALRSEAGAVLNAWNVSRPQRLPPVTVSMPFGSLQPAFATLDEWERELPGGQGKLRIVTLPFRAGTDTYFLQLARPAPPWTGALAGLLWPVLAGALVLGLGARLAAGAIARRALAPLRALAEAARTLSPANLGERFHVQAADAELRRLEAELNAALQRVEEGYRAQAHFATNVAHELKTPIAALVTDAQVSRLGARDPEKARAFLGRAEEELKHLGELVESLLVMARVESHERRDDLVYVDDIVRRAANHCRALAQDVGVGLVVDLPESQEECDPFVRGDAQLLQAMLENLIRNAVDHSPRGTDVRVERSCSPSAVQIAVHDQGPGIDEDMREHVFVRGVRKASTLRGSSGVGLGLAIVNDIAQLHGGTVVIGARESAGCSFTVTLPTELRPAGATERCGTSG